MRSPNILCPRRHAVNGQHCLFAFALLQVRFARRNPHRRNHSVFDVDQMRRFAKMLPGQVGRGSFISWCCIPRPAARDQGLEGLRSADSFAV